MTHECWKKWLLAQSLTVDGYQALLDRGWKRAGCLLYKPEMESTCFPPYTIRLKASNFFPSKEQDRLLKRMQRFLDGTSSKRSDELMDATNTSTVSQISSFNESPHPASEKSLSGAPAKRKLLAEGSEDLLFTSSFSFQIAATLRRHSKEVHVEKTSESGAEGSKQIVDTPKVIAEKLVSHINHLAESSGLLVRACEGHINFYSSERQADEDGVANIVHESKQSSSGNSEYSLYRKYQLRVHNDPPNKVTESSYRRFLVDTPLIFVPPTGDVTVPLCGFGSFHQQYLIDGRLVAVGVIDILPNCLSSKYLFWDPDLAFLSLGKYAALQEIKWVRENQVYCPSLQYYYLGYYIHCCSKMQYKAAYRPSELLCPLRYQWVPFDAARALLDRESYVVLSDFSIQTGEPPSFLEKYEEQNDKHLQGSEDVIVDMDKEMVEFDSEDSDDELNLESSDIELSGIEDGDAGNILIGLREARLRYKDLREAFVSSERQQLMETQLRRYMRAVGRELSERMVYSVR
ncbi:hypothetical protein K7X08_014450 [Anisodus acutangulus]|uniref:Arginyl-tRNA--protein transferase n=1 Tax=Anisodus acutangulus TaxID=402998 RepID=A0A9Q1R2W8_9SOLA|nr:hypothetical protein K7X08_014450 [Anisodus acutangulus]